MADFAQKVAEAVESVAVRTNLRPRACIVLGSGFAAVTAAVSVSENIPYGAIPHFPRTLVGGHPGRLVLGELRGVPVAVFAGRVHYYEGYPMRDVGFSMHLAAGLGARVAILTNAAGAVSSNVAPGDLLLLSDHINLTGSNPLLGEGHAHPARFLDMRDVYDPELRAVAHAAAKAHDTQLRDGVYAMTPGPVFETEAEARMLRLLGADAVGMSTVPEAIAAHGLGMRVLGLSAIANVAAGRETPPLSHEVVLARVAENAPRALAVIEGVLESLAR